MFVTIISAVVGSLWQPHGFSDQGAIAELLAGPGFLWGSGAATSSQHCVAKGPLGDLLIKNTVREWEQSWH